MAQHQRYTGPITVNAAAPFTQSMVDGSQPDRNRCFRKPQIGWQTSQTTFLVVMTPEMFAGYHPDSPRCFRAPRIPLPLHQSAQHVPAPFSQEMVQGQHPNRSRAFQAPKQGWSTSQTTFDVLMTAEMFAGSHPDKSRAWLAPRIPLPISQTTFDVPMTPEQFAGWHPDTSRVKLGPRIPQPISQTTHVPAPITWDMLKGWQPAKPVLWKPFPGGWNDSQITEVIPPPSSSYGTTEVNATYRTSSAVTGTYPTNTGVTATYAAQMAVVGTVGDGTIDQFLFDASVYDPLIFTTISVAGSFTVATYVPSTAVIGTVE